MPPLSESTLLRADENGFSRLATFISDAPNRLRSIMASPLIHPRALASAASPTSDLSKSLVGRQENTVLIPSIYSNMNDSPSPGTVIGAVLGSVFGFILILWLLYSLFNRGGSGAVVAEEDIVVRERRGSRSSRRAETIEVSRSRSRSPLPPRSPVRTTESRTERVIVEERRVPVPVQREDDVVEVIEEHSPPRRSKDRRSRPASGYRSVDPDRYAGGNLPVQEVYGKRSSRHGR